MTARDLNEEELEREAAAWFALLHSGEASNADRQEFEAWLHSSRAHKAVYREFEQVYRDLDYVAVEVGVDTGDRARRGRLHWASRVFDLIRRPAAILTAAAALILIPVGIHFQGAYYERTKNAAASPDYATRTAELKTVTLEDGTVVTLGARSEVNAVFTQTERRVTLLNGEAFFDVTKDPGRPFYVAAQDTLIRVVGTKFDVKRSAEIVHVSVLEGVVEVMKPDDIEQAIKSNVGDSVDRKVLKAGERVSAARRVALPEATQVETAQPGVWRVGRLAYEDASLAEIVADVNRYHNRKVTIASSDVGDLRSTIAFSTSDIDQFFEVIPAIQPVTVDRTPSGDIVIRRAH